jgi:hypothetical protein
MFAPSDSLLSNAEVATSLIKTPVRLYVHHHVCDYGVQAAGTRAPSHATAMLNEEPASAVQKVPSNVTSVKEHV